MAMRWMKSAAAALGMMALAACGPQPIPVEEGIADPMTTRTVAQGEVTGFTNQAGAHVWRAVPFAAAPEGALRWRAPRPADAWEVPYEALTFGPRCPQFATALDEGEDVVPGDLLGDEDCLTLDIYAPAFAPDAVPGAGERLPVMVWIHGGGNVWGRSSHVEGSALANTHNVIVVAIQYRLGPLGWFAHGALRDTAPTGIDLSANFGTLDQIAALQWVQENIAAFGGDPDRVTIFGESAGGHNVAALLASASGNGLFHRAVIQSGTFASVPLAEAEGLTGDYVNPARTVVARLLEEAGMAAEEQDRMSGEALTVFLQDQSLETLFGAYVNPGASPLLDLPRVIADGVELPMDGLITATGRPEGFHRVPVITGTNRDENRFFNFLDPELVDSYFGLVFVAKDPNYYAVVSDYQSHTWKVRAVDDPAVRMTAAGHAPVYGYRFDWDEAPTVLFVTDFSFLLGAGHALEIPFVFGSDQLLGALGQILFTEDNAPGRERLSAAMMSYWTEFAYTGNPGRGRDGDLPVWSSWGADGGNRFMIFDTEADGGVRLDQGRITYDSVLADLADDDRLETDDQRCQVFDAMARFDRAVEPYRRDFLNGACGPQ